MPQSFPDAKTLLQAAAKYLEEELSPTLDGYHRFKTRVTINALNTIRREMELRETQAGAEQKRLAAILKHDGEVDELSRELSERIRDGAIALDNEALGTHIRQSLADAVDINHPTWLTR